MLEQDFLTGIMLQGGNGTMQNDTFGYNPRSERVTWDPSQATATRPLAIQKDGTWYTYGYDITKNVCEVFGPAGLHPHVLQLRSLRERIRFRRRLPTLPMVFGALRLRTRPCLLQLPPLLTPAWPLPLPRPHRRTRRSQPLRLREEQSECLL